MRSISPFIAYTVSQCKKCQRNIGEVFTQKQHWHFILLAVMSLVFCGCSTHGKREGVWLHEGDLQYCKDMAIRMTKDHDDAHPVLVHIEDWRKPIITIYVPQKVRQDLPIPSFDYMSWEFEGMTPYTGAAELHSILPHVSQKFKRTGGGIFCWSNGRFSTHSIR